MTEEHKTNVFSLCKRRKGYREEIAEAVGCSKFTVYNILREIELKYGDGIKEAVWSEAERIAKEEKEKICAMNFGD